MKTRRIHLQPGEIVEIINPFGTSMLKVITRFDHEYPIAIFYPQPDVITLSATDAEDRILTNEPVINTTAQTDPLLPFNPLD